MISISEKTTMKVRMSSNCVRGEQKGAGKSSQIVCWTCCREGFKDMGYEPFKYFQREYSEWLKRLKSLNIL